ncbi:MAG: sigma-70 family RNA polymerase sigma factor [Myxococcota bacterium]
MSDSPADSGTAEDRTAPEAALVARCRDGDSAAWRTLYDSHFDFVWRTARRLGTPEADVEDVAQEVFVVAFHQLQQFHYGRFTTWLYRIVANVVSTRLRRRRVRDFFSGLLGASEDSETPSVEGRVEARRTLAEIERLLRHLSREKREVFALFEIEGLTHEQISELTGVKVETVRTRLHYARKDFEKLCLKRGVVP